MTYAHDHSNHIDATCRPALPLVSSVSLKEIRPPWGLTCSFRLRPRRPSLRDIRRFETHWSSRRWIRRFGRSATSRRRLLRPNR